MRKSQVARPIPFSRRIIPARITFPLACLAVAGLLLSTGTGFASTFNPAGWGYPAHPLQTMNPGAAGSGFATCDTNLVNFYNPAANVGSDRARFYQVVGLENAGAWDNENHDWVSRLRFNGTGWFIPLQDVTLGLYLLPSTDAAFFTHDRGIDSVFVDPEDGSGGEYYRSLQRSGGLYRAAVSCGWQLEPRMAVGVSLDYIGGSTTSIWTLNYGQSPPPYDGQVIQTEELHGMQPRFGVIAIPLPGVQLGLSWAPSVRLRDQITMSNYSTETQSSQAATRVVYPSELVGGIQWGGQRNRVKADLLWRHHNQVVTTDDYQLSLALGYTHNGINLRSNRWWQRLDYHAGIAWQEIQRDYFDEPVRETAVTGGISWQPLGSTSMINTGLQLYNRGELAAHDRQEVGVRVYLAIAIRELWFQRRVERDLP